MIPSGGGIGVPVGTARWVEYLIDMVLDQVIPTFGTGGFALTADKDWPTLAAGRYEASLFIQNSYSVYDTHLDLSAATAGSFTVFVCGSESDPIAFDDDFTNQSVGGLAHLPGVFGLFGCERTGDDVTLKFRTPEPPVVTIGSSGLTGSIPDPPYDSTHQAPSLVLASFDVDTDLFVAWRVPIGDVSGLTYGAIFEVPGDRLLVPLLVANGTADDVTHFGFLGGGSAMSGGGVNLWDEFRLRLRRV